MSVLALSATAQSVAFRPDLREVTKRADLAFLGHVASLHVEARPDIGMAFTHVVFRVEQLLFDRTGSAPRDLITLVFAGGAIDDEIVKVMGVPEFRVGEEAVVLTYYDGHRYASPIVGRSAGLFRVVQDEQTYRRYPLSADGAGIEAIQKGSLVLADRVEGVRAGRPTYLARAPFELAAAPPAPVPANGAIDVPWPTLSRLPEGRPNRLLELQELLDSIDLLYRELPAGRK